MVETLLREPETPVAPVHAEPGGHGPGDEPVVVPDFACHACGAGMDAGQDWCLECGTAAPGRLGARPGWRAALTVVALTLVLVGGAVVASYAAMTTDAQREASRPAPESAAPIVAAPPAAPVPAVPPAGALPPADETPTIPAPEAEEPEGGIEIPEPDAGVTPAPAPAPVTPSPSGGSSGSSGSPGGESAPSAPQVVDLAASQVRRYDPYDRAGAEFGPAADAVDGDPETVWDVTVPADGETINAGLVVDLGRERAISSLRVDTPTSGYRVEVYGARGSETPPDILDKRWDKLAVGTVRDGEPIQLDADQGYRKVVLWITAPADADDPRAAIGEIRLSSR